MTLTFKSSIPESFRLIGTDPDGRQRMVTASKNPGDFHWRLNLRHPSGENWNAMFHAPGGAGILDAMSELMRSKDAEFRQDKARGDRPRERQAFDHNRSVDGYAPPIGGTIRRIG
jgi:hypothetical protein